MTETFALGEQKTSSDPSFLGCVRFLLETALILCIFSHSNIFINYQLTKRRGELSKGIRKLKTDNVIERYYVDANGRFFCYKPGNNQKHEIKTLNDIKAITAAATNAS